jgi:hypothetical protein
MVFCKKYSKIKKTLIEKEKENNLISENNEIN